MANISKELEAIMSAIYGRDVRQSIHDGIDKINKVSEVTLLAGTDIDSVSSSTSDPVTGQQKYYDGSLYINTDDWVLWQCTGVDTWQNLGQFGGQDGVGISSIDKTGTSGNVDTYTITYTDGNSTTFDVTNGIDGTHGSVWYKGTAITGNGSGLTGYPGVANDFYLNSSTGYIYQCYQTGDGTTALWAYVMAMAGGGGGASNLTDLGDVTIGSGLSANQILKYDGDSTNPQWRNVDDDGWTEAQVCAEDSTSKTFTGLDATKAYDAYFECPNGVQSPAIISIYPASATSVTVTFKPVTAAQAGTGSDCKLKLRELA